jgi:uncharacterized C2H2 Zn-finger protein
MNSTVTLNLTQWIKHRSGRCFFRTPQDVYPYVSICVEAISHVTKQDGHNFDRCAVVFKKHPFKGAKLVKRTGSDFLVLCGGLLFSMLDCLVAYLDKAGLKGNFYVRFDLSEEVICQ